MLKKFVLFCFVFSLQFPQAVRLIVISLLFIFCSFVLFCFYSVNKTIFSLKHIQKHQSYVLSIHPLSRTHFETLGPKM